MGQFGFFIRRQNGNQYPRDKQAADQAQYRPSGRRVVKNERFQNNDEKINPFSEIFRSVKKRQSQKYMKNHIDGQVGSVAQSGVEPAALVSLQYPKQLENAIKGDNGASQQSGVKKPIPNFFRFHCSRQDKEIGEQVEISDQAFHSFVIGPEASVKILSKDRRQGHDTDKNSQHS